MQTNDVVPHFFHRFVSKGKAMVRYSSDITDEIQKIILDRLNTFNQGKKSDEGRYYILLPNERTLYYTLWFYNPEAIYHSFIYLSNLELSAIGSVNKAIKIVFNSYLPLGIIREIDSPVRNGDDILMFGKYRGFHLQEIYTIDPRYVLWIADKYEPRVRSEFRFKELAINYSKVYLDLQTRRRYKTPTSRHVGTLGEKLANLNLTIVKVRIEDDAYKTRIMNGIAHFYVDQFITAVDAAGNLFLFTIKAKDRSLVSKVLPPSSHAYYKGEKLSILSAKVLKHLELHNIQYTKLGYVQLGS